VTAVETSPSAIESSRPDWLGVNHLALITNDMDSTVRFYHGVLGARLVCTIGTASFRHYFFEFGSHCTVAFFEYSGVDIQPFAKPAGVPDARATQFDHLSLNLADEQALHDLRRRLRDADCEVTEVVDHQVMRSIYFTDPNGIALEASWWVRDPTAGPVDYSDRALFGDANPVAAVDELQAAGRLTKLPKTRLT
jgi:catechol 2,3-dioxygenase-like lactoylglutathione lyase family enzyme